VYRQEEAMAGGACLEEEQVVLELEVHHLIYP
jgi:hypothetical protein